MAYNKQGPKHQGRSGSYVGHHWYDDIVVLPDDERTMPPTVPHHVIASHRLGCECRPCETYPAELQAQLKRKGARSAARSPE